MASYRRKGAASNTVIPVLEAALLSLILEDLFVERLRSYFCFILVFQAVHRSGNMTSSANEIRA